MTAWTAIALVALVNFAMKAAGPVALSGRTLPRPLTRIIALLGPALLAALVVVDTVSSGRHVAIDARVVGLAAAAAAAALRAPMLVAILLAPVAAASVRALGWG